MSKNKVKIAVIAIAVAFTVGYSAGRYVLPAKVEVKKEEVVREVEVIKRDIRIIEREIKRPDGTIERERIEEDKSTENTKKEKENKEHSVVTNEKSKYRVRGGTGFNFANKTQEHSVGLEKRFWGPAFLGADLTLSPSMRLDAAKVTLSWEF